MTEDRQLVSVIIAAYNHEGYVGDAIESVLNQSYKNWELVIINDGSTDGTVHEIKKYLQDKRIRFFDQENQGVVKTLNRGVALAKGDLVCFLDSDDKFAPKKIEDQTRIVASGADIVPTKIKQIDASGKIIDISQIANYFNDLPFSEKSQKEIVENFDRANYFCKSSVLVKKRFFEELDGFNSQLSYAYDYDFWLRVINSGACVKWDENENTLYRLHENNETRRGKERMALETILVLYSNFLKNRDQREISITHLISDDLKEKTLNLVLLTMGAGHEENLYDLATNKKLISQMKIAVDHFEEKHKKTSDLYATVKKTSDQVQNLYGEIKKRDQVVAIKDKNIIYLHSIISERNATMLENEHTNSVLRERLAFVTSSKFWKMREKYCKFKNIFKGNGISAKFSEKLKIKNVKNSSKDEEIEEITPPKLGEVAMVCSTGLIGGAEKVFEQHVKFLAQTFSVDVYFQHQGGPVADFLKPVARNIFIGDENCTEENLARYKYVYLVQVLPDVAKIKKINPKTKVSFIVHDPVLWINELNKVPDVVHYIDHFFSISSLIQENLLGAFPEIAPEKSSILYNSFCFALDTKEESLANVASREKTKTDFVWGYAGRFSFEKNTLGIVEMFSEIVKEHPQQRLILAGDISITDNPDLVEYKTKILTIVKQTPQIDYWGYQDDLTRFYKNIDGLVMASFIEGISVAALDALAYGVPVLTTNVGSMGEIVKDGFNGCMVDLDMMRENPFDDKDIKFSKKEKSSFKSAMESFRCKKWDRKEIIERAYSIFSKKVIKNIFMRRVGELTHYF